MITKTLYKVLIIYSLILNLDLLAQDNYGISNEFHSNNIIESNKYLQVLEKVQNLEKLINSIKTKIKNALD